MMRNANAIAIDQGYNDGPASNFTYARVGPRDVRKKDSVCISKGGIACKRHKLLERKALPDLLSENRVINPWRC